MRRSLFALLTLLCLAALPAAGQQATTVTVIGTSVNLRKGASADSGVVQALPKGTLLTVIVRDGQWIKVQVRGQTASGWVRADLVDTVPASAAAATAPAVGAPKAVSSAKDDGYRGGLTLFAGISSFTVDLTPAMPNVTYSNTSGLAAGVGFITHLGGPVGVELDGEFVQSGYTATFAGGTITTHANNVGAALLLRPAFGSGPVRVFLQGGVSLDYSVSCSTSYSTGTAPPCTFDPGAKRTAESLVFGAGASYRMVGLQLRYDIGLNNLNGDDTVIAKSNGLLLLLSVTPK